MKIPYGTTISYGELACRIHNPKAVRAVASANATNPISIFVPCHRVIGSNHKLTGYGGGLDAKKGLLELECSKTMGSVYGRFNIQNHEKCHSRETVSGTFYYFSVK